MNQITHILDPKRLLVVWQPSLDNTRRSRRVVAEILRNGSGQAVFRYLKASDDYRHALEAGFRGFPAFNLSEAEHHHNVLDVFLRRLPPRNREDFADYLRMYRLPSPFTGTDEALLAYTGARLPGDGFEIAADLSDAIPPFEFVMEVAGFRYQDGIKVDSLSVGDSVTLAAEKDNSVDPNAIAVKHTAGKIGYVCRPYLDACHKWLRSADVDATIDRVNGTASRPLIYLFVRVSP